MESSSVSGNKIAWERASPSTSRFMVHSRADDHQSLLAPCFRAFSHSLGRNNPFDATSGVGPTAAGEGKGTPAGKPSFAAPNSPSVANPQIIRDHSTGGG